MPKPCGRPAGRRNEKICLNLFAHNNPLPLSNCCKARGTRKAPTRKFLSWKFLNTGLSESDLVWLESLKEKGTKVNNAIQDLIKRIPASQPVQSYMTLLKEAVTVKTSKALLGMLAKTTVDVNEKITFPDPIFKSGIEKLSSDKNVSDTQYILIQLIASVPPSF